MRSALAVIAVVVALVVVACKAPPCGYSDNCSYACSDDANCAEQGPGESGFVCKPLRHDVGLKCTPPCTTSKGCRAIDRCRCQPDNRASGFCDIEPYDPIEALDGRCDGDFDRATTCALLCDCQCSSHQDCPGGGQKSECVSRCTGAYETFPACATQLDAYYLCAQRRAVCQSGYVYDGGPSPCSGFPACWAKPPGAACPDEMAAVQMCTGTQNWGGV